MLQPPPQLQQASAPSPRDFAAKTSRMPQNLRAILPMLRHESESAALFLHFSKAGFCQNPKLNRQGKSPPKTALSQAETRQNSPPST
jgi:hypothetical protein